MDWRSAWAWDRPGGSGLVLEDAGGELACISRFNRPVAEEHGSAAGYKVPILFDPHDQDPELFAESISLDCPFYQFGIRYLTIGKYQSTGHERPG